MSPLSGKYFSMKLTIVSWRKVVVNYLLTLPGSSVLRWDNRLQPWWNIPYGCKSGFTSNIPWFRRKGTTILAKNPWNTYARPFPPAMLRCYCKVAWLQQHCKREGENKREQNNFSKLFQGFCLRLSEVAGNFRSMRKKCQIRLEHF